jgi:hypothetical protein
MRWNANLIDMLSEGLATQQLSSHLSLGEMKPIAYPQNQHYRDVHAVGFLSPAQEVYPIATAW